MTATRARISVYRLGIVAFAFVGLELLCRFGVIDPLTLLPPSEIVLALIEVLESGRHTADILATSKIMVISVAVSIVIGIVGGVVLHLWPRLKRAVSPLLTSYYAVPIFVLYPTFILIFGLNDIPKVIVGALFAVIVMTINTLNGLERVPEALIKTARSLNLGLVERIRLVLLPSAFPYLLTGIKLAIAYCFIGVIAAEFILSTVGLGHAIAFAYNDFDNRTMYGLMLLVLITVTGINLWLHGWEKRVRMRRGET